MPTYFWVIIAIIVALLVIVFGSMIFARSLIAPPAPVVTAPSSGVVYDPTAGGASPPAPLGTSGSYVPELATAAVGDLRGTTTVDTVQPVIDAVRSIVTGIQTVTNSSTLMSKINRTNAAQFPTVSEVRLAYDVAAKQKIDAGEKAAADQLLAEKRRAEEAAKRAEQIRMLLTTGFECGRDQMEMNMLGGCEMQKTTGMMVANGACPAGYTKFTSSGTLAPGVPTGAQRCVATVPGKTAKYLILGPSYQDPKPNKFMGGLPMYGTSNLYMTYM